MTSVPNATVEVRNLSKIYRRPVIGRQQVVALRDVSLRVEPGEVFGLLGPNRAGKTTLLKILMSLCRPTSGDATRLGSPVSERWTLERIGYMHEDQALPQYLSASSVLAFYGALSLVPRDVLKTRIPALLEQVGLADRAHEPIGRFSKGMLRRLALAQALINQPELLVLDEPSEGLDQFGRRLLHDIIRRRREDGSTTILVSHTVADIEQLCDRVAVLVNGRLVYLGPLSDLARDVNGNHCPLDQALIRVYEGRDG